MRIQVKEANPKRPYVLCGPDPVTPRLEQNYGDGRRTRLEGRGPDGQGSAEDVQGSEATPKGPLVTNTCQCGCVQTTQGTK